MRSADLTLHLPRMGAALAIAVAGWVAWPLFTELTDAGFSAIANAFVGSLTFGEGGHVALRPAMDHDHDYNASWSTLLELRIDGIDDRNLVRINPRRLVYLPCLLLAAVVLASPLTPRRKAVALIAGCALLISAALLSIWLIAAWLFARIPGLVYELSGLEQRMLRFGYEAWVSAIGSRVVAPIVVSAALIGLLSERRSSSRPLARPTRPRRPRAHAPSRARPRNRHAGPTAGRRATPARATRGARRAGTA
jgi:hypothetical protein